MRASTQEDAALQYVPWRALTATEASRQALSATRTCLMMPTKSGRKIMSRIATQQRISKKALLATVLCAFALMVTGAPQAADSEGPLMLARDGYFYVNAKTKDVKGKTYVTDQMYVEVRIPARQTHPY